MSKTTRELTQGLRQQHEGATEETIKSLVAGTCGEIWELIQKQYTAGAMASGDIYPAMLKLVYLREAANAAMDGAGPEEIGHRAVGSVETLIEKILEEDRKVEEGSE